MNSALTVHLTEQFYAWEVRGRGWMCFERPVMLEPPFVPFRRGSLGPAPPLEDGRVPTLFGSLIDRAVGLFSGHQSSASQEEDPLLNLDVEEDLGEFERTFVTLRLPLDGDITPELCRQILLTFGTLRYPLTLEIVATSEHICMQLSGEQTDIRHACIQLQAFLPEIGLCSTDDRLMEAFGNTGNVLVIDFGLGEEFMRPLRQWRGSEGDPFVAIVGAVSELPRDHTAAMQVMFTPVHHPWASNAMRAVTDEQGGGFFADDPAMLPLAREKLSLPLYAVSLRLASRAPRQTVAWDVARRLGSAVMILNAPGSNELIPLEDVNYAQDKHLDDFLRRRTPRPGMLLNLAELASLVHPPSSDVRVPLLERLTGATKAPPEACSRGEVKLGRNTHHGIEHEVWLTTQQRLRHCHLIGGSGTGKSTLLLQMMLQDAQAGRGFALLDPHGDLSDQLLDRLPQHRIGDVCLFDPADEEFPVGLNVLQARSESEKTLLSSDLVAVMRRLSTSWGDQMTSVLGNAILAVLEHKDGGTLLDLRRLLVEESFRREYLQGVQDAEVVYYWQREFPLLTGKPQASLLTRLDTFLRPRVIRHIVAQKDSLLDFRAMLDRRGILVGKLPQGLIGEENAFLLGTLLVTKIHQAALGRQDMRIEDRQPFYLYIDEFHNFVTPSMAPILSGVRKFGLGLVLAHQEMRQLGRDSEVANAVLSNAAVRVCFRLGDSDARTLASGFTAFDASQLQRLGVGEAICRVQRADWDFNLTTEMLPDIEETEATAQRQRISQLSRQKLARPVEEVRKVLENARPIEPVSTPKRRGTLPSDSPQTKPIPPPPIEELAPPPQSVPITQPEAIIPAVASPILPSPSPPVPAVTTASSATQPPTPPDRKPPPQGKGGQEHRYLQQLIKQWADGMGWKSTIECAVKDGGSIDVELRKAKHRIGVEISVTTDVAQESQNIRKCLAAGCTAVVAVGTKPRRLTKLKAMIQTELDAKDHEKVRCYAPEELLAWLSEQDATITTKSSTVRGYRVNLNYQSLTDTQKTSRQQAISDVIRKSMRRVEDGG